MATETRQVTDVAPAKAPTVFLSGSFPGKLDAKGRTILPPAFRQKLLGEVLAFPSLTEPVVEIGGEVLREALLRAVEKLGAVDRLDRRLTKLHNYIAQNLQPLAVDDAGRVTLPSRLKEHAQLEGPLTFAGRGSHFVLATARYLETHDADAHALGEEMGETFAALMRPSVGEGG
ncbi:MAG: hypothetical protein AAGH41_01770 [Pseudomonadota bacterium]